MRNLEKFSSHVRSFSRVVLLSFLSVTFLLAGCVGLKPEEIVARAIAATSKVNTYKSDTTSDLLVSSLSDSSVNQTLIQSTISSTAIVDITGRKSYAFGKLPIMGVETQAESYVFEGYSYNHYLEDTRWVKWKIEDDYEEAEKQIFLYTSILESASQVTGRGIERINGIDSYVIELAPRVDVLNSESRLQLFGTLLYLAIGVTEALSFVDAPPPSLIVTATYWINESTFLFNQVQIAISFNIENKVDNKNVDIKHKIRFDDYNKEVAISLPPEAQKAVEVSP